jgi:hypothetical protein
VQPLLLFARRIVGSDAVESGHEALRTRRGPFPPPHPSFLDTAKRGHDAGSETRPSSCSPPPKQQSQDATSRGGSPASTFTPSIHAQTPQQPQQAKDAMELRSPRA